MNKPAAYWIAGAFLMVLVLLKFSPQTGFTELIRFGETWADRRHSVLENLPLATIPSSSGYDGQFYAQIALDPLLRGSELAKVIDTPEYRARRILTPAAAALAGMGRPWWTLQAYALLNVFCWFTLAWLLYREIPQENYHAFARWMGCMFSMGVLESVRQSLVDLPALLLLALAVKSYKEKPFHSTRWLVLANLAKETSLLGAAALFCGKPSSSFSWRRTGLSLLICALPLALWSLYVRQRFLDIPASPGMGNFSWPFLGLLMQVKYALRELSLGNFESRYSFGLIAIIALLIQGWFFWRSPSLQSPWWRIGAAYSLLLIFLGSWVWSGYWAACRAVLPMSIAFNLLLPGTRAFWPWWIAGNIPILHAVWRFL